MQVEHKIFRARGSSRFGAAVMAGLVGLSAAGGGVGTIILLQRADFYWAVPVACMTVLLTGAAGYVFRDLKAKYGWRVEIKAETVRLSLPAERSLYHRPARFDGELRLDEISGVECRPELYAQLGAESLVETWWLICKTGDALLLAEDRSVNPTYEIRTVFAKQTAEAIARAASVKVKQRQPAKGHPGILGLWGVRPPAA